MLSGGRMRSLYLFNCPVATLPHQFTLSRLVIIDCVNIVDVTSMNSVRCVLLAGCPEVVDVSALFNVGGSICASGIVYMWRIGTR